MNSKKVAASNTTPLVKLDPVNGVFEMSGCSRPENVANFFQPIIEWLNEYAQTPCELTVFNFNLTYFNTASSKAIYDVMMILREIHNAGKNIEINWRYSSDDSDMEDAGIEFADIIEFPIKMIKY